MPAVRAYLGYLHDRSDNVIGALRAQILNSGYTVMISKDGVSVKKN